MNKRINTNVGILLFLMSAAILVLTDFVVIGYELDYKYSSKDQNCVKNTVSINNSITSNDYQIFSKKMKEQISSKYNSNAMEYQYIKSSVISDGYVVSLNQSGSLVIKYSNSDLNSKFGDYKIADNVLSFYVISEGQGGGNSLYFINLDGTVGSADVEYGVANNGVIDVKTDLGYKNIVSIVSGGFGMEYSGSNGPIFIDINGNIFSQNLK